jgi:hypothetical protein
MSQDFDKLWFCGDDLPEGAVPCEKTPVVDVYILCFYFAMTTLTTVGYGDVGPLNSIERVFVSILQIFGVVIFSTIMNQLSMVLDNMSFQEQEKEFRLSKTRRFLKKHGVDGTLSRRILGVCVCVCAGFIACGRQRGKEREYRSMAVCIRMIERQKLRHGEIPRHRGS